MLSGTFREQRIFLNCLRFLANDLHLPLVCVGTNEAKQALMTDQQLADRFEARELPAWRDDTGFHQLLASFGSTLPLRRAPQLVCTRKRRTQQRTELGRCVRVVAGIHVLPAMPAPTDQRWPADTPTCRMDAGVLDALPSTPR